MDNRGVFMERVGTEQFNEGTSGVGVWGEGMACWVGCKSGRSGVRTVYRREGG